MTTKEPLEEKVSRKCREVIDLCQQMAFITINSLHTKTSYDIRVKSNILIARHRKKGSWIAVTKSLTLVAPVLSVLQRLSFWMEDVGEELIIVLH